MKKNVLLSSIVLSVVTLIGTPMIANANVDNEIAKYDQQIAQVKRELKADEDLFASGKVSFFEALGLQRKIKSKHQEIVRIQNLRGGLVNQKVEIEGNQRNSEANQQLNNAKLNIPNARPVAQNIQMNSYNDVQEKAKEKKQGQIPYAPPVINQETIQKWNHSTINEFEEQGQAATRSKYSNFRSNPHGYR